MVDVVLSIVFARFVECLLSWVEMIICENALQVKLMVEAWFSYGGKNWRTFPGACLKIQF